MKHKNQTKVKCCPVEGHSIWETDNKVSQTAADWARASGLKQFYTTHKAGLRSEATLWRANATTAESAGHLETPSAPPSLCHSINLANFPELKGGEMYTLTGLWPESGAGLRGFNLPSPFPPPPITNACPKWRASFQNEISAVWKKKRNRDRNTCSDKMTDSGGENKSSCWDVPGWTRGCCRSKTRRQLQTEASLSHR